MDLSRSREESGTSCFAVVGSCKQSTLREDGFSSVGLEASHEAGRCHGYFDEYSSGDAADRESGVTISSGTSSSLFLGAAPLKEDHRETLLPDWQKGLGDLNLRLSREDVSSSCCDGPLLQDLHWIKEASCVQNANNPHPLLQSEHAGSHTSRNEMVSGGNSNFCVSLVEARRSGGDEIEKGCVAPEYQQLDRDMKRALHSFGVQLSEIQRSLEAHIQVFDANRLRLEQWGCETSLGLHSSRTSESDSITPLSARPRSVSVSLLTGDRGEEPPSTREAIEKANVKQLYPSFRRKYDWSLKLWTPQDCQRLWALTASRLQTDLHKLIVEEELFEGVLHPRQVVERMLELKAHAPQAITGSGDSENEKEMMRQQWSELEEALKRKAFRMAQRNTASSSNAEDFKELLVIVLPSGSSLVNNNDCNLTPAYVSQMYWRQFWDAVALAMGTRYDWSGRDCQIQWEHHQSPFVKLVPFSAKEDAEILALRRRYPHDWDAVAQKLNTGRTAYQCFERYQRVLNGELLGGEWTPEEDKELRLAVMEAGEVKEATPGFWSRIALRFPNRSNLQCRARYMNCLRGEIKHGAWSPKEDLLLQLLVYCYGRARWVKIARHFADRTDVKCRERYEKVIGPAATLCQRQARRIALLSAKQDWTVLDSRYLSEALEKYGPRNWKAVAVRPGSQPLETCSNPKWRRLGSASEALFERWWHRIDPFGASLYDMLQAYGATSVVRRQRKNREKIKQPLRALLRAIETRILFATPGWMLNEVDTAHQNDVEEERVGLTHVEDLLRLDPPFHFWTLFQNLKLSKKTECVVVSVITGSFGCGRLLASENPVSVQAPLYCSTSSSPETGSLTERLTHKAVTPQLGAFGRFETSNAFLERCKVISTLTMILDRITPKAPDVQELFEKHRKQLLWDAEQELDVPHHGVALNSFNADEYQLTLRKIANYFKLFS